MNSFNGLKRGLHGGENNNPKDVRNTTIDDLDDALLEKILVRLSVKTVHQGKSVSTRWLNLISTPWFVRRFVQHRISTLASPMSQLPFAFIPGLHGWPICREKCLVSSHDMFGPDDFSLTFLPCYNNTGSIRVVGTSNDLIICRADKSPTVYYICNPFTRHWAEIPLAPAGGGENNDTYDDSIIGFMSDPYYKVVEDHENGNHTVVDIPYSYKIVRVTGLTSSPNSSMKMETFSSETSEWSKSQDGSCTRSLQKEFYSRNCSGAFVCNGKLHWLRGTHHIFAYDLFNNNNNNILEVIDRPEKLRGYTNVHLGVCRGRPRLLKFLTDTWENNIFEVWELEDYNTFKWCKFEDVRSDPANANSVTARFFSAVKDHLTNVASVAFHPYDGDIVYLCFFFYIYSCNMRQGTFELVIKGSSKTIDFALFQPWFPTPVSSLPSLT